MFLVCLSQGHLKLLSPSSWTTLHHFSTPDAPLSLHFLPSSAAAVAPASLAPLSKLHIMLTTPVGQVCWLGLGLGSGFRLPRLWDRYADCGFG